MEKIYFLVSLFIISCIALPWDDMVIEEEKEIINPDEWIVRRHYKQHVNVIPDGAIAWSRIIEQRNNNVTLFGFSWDNCGDKTDTIQVKTLAVSPDPIVIPGTVTVTLDATIASTIQTATSLTLKVQKKLFGVFIDIPCVGNIGSCTYNEPCNFLRNITCPPSLKALGWTCRCPIPAKEYKLDAMAFKIPKLNLPSFIENGDYEIKATLMNGSTQLGCYEVKASLKAQ